MEIEPNSSAVNTVSPDTVPLFGLSISRMNHAETLDWLQDQVLAPARRALVFSANVDQIVRCRTDAAFHRIYQSANLIVPDGMPVVWSARFLRRELRERVTGIDLMYGLCELCAKNGYSCYLLGSRHDVVELAARKLQERFPQLLIRGWQDGYFFPQESDAVVSAICKARPDVLFVGMGSPRQELWLQQNFSKLPCSIGLPVGGSFDVIAGRLRRAPVAMQRLGMEWSWRLLQEPKRLWRRYLLEDLKFLHLVAGEWKSHGRSARWTK